MGRKRNNGGSPGLALYRLLLQLYPPAYLRRHRAELLQNFQDLERAMPSSLALWLFIAKDLAVSLGVQRLVSQYRASRMGLAPFGSPGSGQFS